jgi:polar amino acid transport system substrate-binding protein
VRKRLVLAATAAIVLAACSTKTTGNTAPTSAGPSATGPNCSTTALNLVTPGQLTIATDNPAFQPWFGGAKGSGQPPWQADPNSGTGNPYSGQGFEGAVAYAAAGKLGFTPDHVKWVAVNFNNSYKPGPKSFDFFVGQVSYSAARSQAVDFSSGYYDVQQALVAKKGAPITSAKTFADLQGYKLGAQIGTTSYSYIVDNIKPTQQPSVYDNSNDVIAALNAGQIDGYLVDAPTAYVNVLISEVKNGVVVGQFPTLGAQEYFGLVFQKGNPLVPCVDQAIASLRSAGTLDSLQSTWLADITYPVIQPS